MKRVLLLLGFLIVGLVLSQIGPMIFGPTSLFVETSQKFLTMALLAYIMIEVGREFELDFSKKREYAVDYMVAATAAAFPWIFVSGYFLFFLMPEVTATGKPAWMEALLAGRFAAPTSAGVLFSLLAAAGLSKTWTYKKTRILAIFDDLDTVLLMIPLQILMVGMVWQLGGVLTAIALILVLGFKYYKKISWPTTWPWILFYALVMTAISEGLYLLTKDPATKVGLHIEILLPAFVLGCSLRNKHHEHIPVPGKDTPGLSADEVAGIVISCVFLFLVGLSMPSLFATDNALGSMSVTMLVLHVLAVTVISNLGKMFACFCYRKEASFKERLAVSVSMFPRGEVGAGILALALGYGMAGPFITVAFLSLALNLILTGVFIYIVQKLLSSEGRTHA